MSQTDTVGIVGGGQLGRMLTEAAHKLSFQVTVVDPGENSPAAQVGATQIVGALNDKQSLEALAKVSDVITIEIEHVDSDILQSISQEGKAIHPSPKTIKMIQDKFLQKTFLSDAGLPVAKFTIIDDAHTAEQALESFGGKMILKTRFGAYDGRGNAVITCPSELESAIEMFKDQQLYAEELLAFDKELAVMIARSYDGAIALFPVVETIQERNICTEVIAPAQIDNEIREKAKSVAQSVAEHLEGASAFGIELFLTKSGDILINEIAPRVHNSGHYTIEACKTSQFDQHIRAITGMDLGSSELIVPAAVMINILGERNGETTITGLVEAEKIPGTTIHLYGKSPTKIDRKMGHITSVANTIEEARDNALKARKLIGI